MDNFDPYIFEYFYKYTRAAYDCVCAPGTRVCVCVFLRRHLQLLAYMCYSYIFI